MSHRILAVGLTVLLAALLTVSMLFVLAPAPTQSVAHAEIVAGPTTAATPAAAIRATIVNGYDVPTDLFYLGAVGYGSLYFLITDPTIDHTVNVTITDPNAVRDGIGTPAFSYAATLNPTTHSFDSYTAGVSYTFPTTIPYGGHWSVNFSAPVGGTVIENVSLLLYYTTVTTSVGTTATLPGQMFTLFWALNLESNAGSAYTKATSGRIYGSFTGNGTVENLFGVGGESLGSMSTGRGTLGVTVPFNAGPETQLHIEVSAITNVSGQVVENESANITVNVGALVIHGIGLTPAPPTCELVNDGVFTIGSVIAGCVEVGASYAGAFTALPGLPITVGYWNGTAHVSPLGAPTELTSNATGEAAFTFAGTVPPFTPLSSADIYNVINFTVTVPGASTFYHWTVYSNATVWTLVPATSTGVVQLTLDHTTYYSPSVATATWWASTIGTKVGALTAIGWTVTGPDAVTYEQGTLNTTADSGTFSFPVVAAMVGHTIRATVYVVNATETFAASATAAVLNPTLILTPAEYYFVPATSTSVSVLLNGGGVGPNVVIQYQVWEYTQGNANLLSNGTVANGSSISILPPDNPPPQSIVVDAWASVDGQVIASSSTAILAQIGYSVELGVATVSSYSDGSFQPGQTVTLSYQVISVGGAALPQVVSFELFAIGYPYVQTLTNVGPSGTVPFTIPSNAPQGTIVVELLARGSLSAGTCFPAGTCDGIAALYVNPSPSALNLEVGGGVTVGWLILLVLVVILAVALLLVLFLRRRGGMKPASASSSGGSAPPQEWKGPSSPPGPSEPPASGPTTSESQPPLPPPAQPPTGAT